MAKLSAKIRFSNNETILLSANDSNVLLNMIWDRVKNLPISSWWKAAILNEPGIDQYGPQVNALTNQRAVQSITWIKRKGDGRFVEPIRSDRFTHTGKLSIQRDFTQNAGSAGVNHSNRAF